MRTTEQRFLDRFKNAGNMLTSGIGGSWRQATETNPNLNRWGNAADTVNGLVGMAGNVIGAAGEVIGVGDAVQGIGAGIDIATAAALDAANSAEADIRFADTAMGAEGAKNTVVRPIQGFADANPNAAEGMKAVVNVATAGYAGAKTINYVLNNYEFTGLDVNGYKLKQMGAVSVPSKSVERTYKDAPYHGKADTTAKNKAPTNGQSALDQSIQVKNTSTRRVGVDKENQEFVVFDKTITHNNSNEEFHGHVRSWKELHPEHQQALIGSGLVTKKGKIK